MLFRHWLARTASPSSLPLSSLSYNGLSFVYFLLWLSSSDVSLSLKKWSNKKSIWISGNANDFLFCLSADIQLFYRNAAEKSVPKFHKLSIGSCRFESMATDHGSVFNIKKMPKTKFNVYMYRSRNNQL